MSYLSWENMVNFFWIKSDQICPKWIKMDQIWISHLSKHVTIKRCTFKLNENKHGQLFSYPAYTVNPILANRSIYLVLQSIQTIQLFWIKSDQNGSNFPAKGCQHTSPIYPSSLSSLSKFQYIQPIQLIQPIQSIQSNQSIIQSIQPIQLIQPIQSIQSRDYL